MLFVFKSFATACSFVSATAKGCLPLPCKPPPNTTPSKKKTYDTHDSDADDSEDDTDFCPEPVVDLQTVGLCDAAKRQHLARCPCCHTDHSIRYMHSLQPCRHLMCVDCHFTWKHVKNFRVKKNIECPVCNQTRNNFDYDTLQAFEYRAKGEVQRIQGGRQHHSARGCRKAAYEFLNKEIRAQETPDNRSKGVCFLRWKLFARRQDELQAYLPYEEHFESELNYRLTNAKTYVSGSTPCMDPKAQVTKVEAERSIERRCVYSAIYVHPRLLHIPRKKVARKKESVKHCQDTDIPETYTYTGEQASSAQKVIDWLKGQPSGSSRKRTCQGGAYI